MSSHPDLLPTPGVQVFLIAGLLGATLSCLAPPVTAAPLTQALHRLEWVENAIREAGRATATPPPSSISAPSSGFSDLGLLMDVAVRLYRETLSSQDSPVCNYEPSCSHYAQDAIRLRGPLIGALMAGDRLERCIGAARRFYPIDPATQKALDPVRIPDRLSGD
jgi:putative component of membrane protein insertase Oxa1/YidC/SpoIIIJ protein YidD